MVARAVVAALEPPAVQGSTRFGAGFLQGGPDFPPEEIPGGGFAYRVNMDFFITFSPA